MIRILSILGGLFFVGALAWSLLWDTIGLAHDGLPKSAERSFHIEHPKPLKLASDGWFGKFDKKQLKRGFEVYQQVCSNCHSLTHVAYRDLAALDYSPNEIKELAAKATVNAKDPLTGEVKDRPGQPSDHFPPVVYAGQGHPPDLSLITKARHGGAAYVHSLLTGYADQAGYKNAKGEVLLEKFPEAKTPDGLYFNPYFANLNIAMPPPLTSDGQVTYSDGTKATVDQMATDAAAFLVWTAEPKLDKRHQVGFWWIGFLIYATVLGYMAYRNVWAGQKH